MNGTSQSIVLMRSTGDLAKMEYLSHYTWSVSQNPNKSTKHRPASTKHGYTYKQCNVKKLATSTLKYAFNPLHPGNGIIPAFRAPTYAARWSIPRLYICRKIKSRMIAVQMCGPRGCLIFC